MVGLMDGCLSGLVLKGTMQRLHSEAALRFLILSHVLWDQVRPGMD